MVSACSKHEGWWQGSRNIWDGCVRKGIRCDHLCHVQVTKVTPLRIRKEKKETYHVMLKCCQQCRFWSFVPQSWLLSCKYGSDKRSQGAVLQPPHLPQRAARDQAEEHSVHPGQPVHLWLLLSGGCWDCSANCHQGWSGRKKKIPDKNCAQKSLNTTPDCLSEEVMFVIVSACVRVITLCVNVTAWKVWIVCL